MSSKSKTDLSEGPMHSLNAQVRQIAMVMQDEVLSILYIGQLSEGSTSLQRANALADLGHDVVRIDTCRLGRLDCFRRILWKVRWMAGFEWDIANANEHMLERCQRIQFDLIWLDKALSIRPSTLKMIRRYNPKALICGYSPDDMAARHNQSSYFLRSLPLHDLYVTTKSYNVPELLKLGAQRVELLDNAFDPATHRPVLLTSEEFEQYGADVGFIGTFELERAQTLRFLQKEGISVRIFGNAWDRFTREFPEIQVRPAVMGLEYSKALVASKINLCFLRRCNRDLQTTRSIEIPACGAFMLAERTDEHLRLFEEGVEAEFFSGSDELLRKVRYYLANDLARERIAKAGLQRCLRGGYSNQSRLDLLLKRIVEWRLREHSH